jgi:hypothetical protein
MGLLGGERDFQGKGVSKGHSGRKAESGYFLKVIHRLLLPILQKNTTTP